MKIGASYMHAKLGYSKTAGLGTQCMVWYYAKETQDRAKRHFLSTNFHMIIAYRNSIYTKKDPHGKPL